MNWIASVQPVLVGAVLLWAGAVKLLSRSAPVAAGRSALARLVGADRVLAAYRAVGCVELAVAAVLVLPPVYPAEGLAAAGLGAGMLGYLGYARRAAPDSSCGCLGAKRAPVSGRAFARAGVLTAGGGLAVFAANWWPAALVDRPLGTLGLLAGQAALVVLLSPELDGYWLLPLRRLRLRIHHPLAGRPFGVPLAATVQQLHKSAAYASVAELLRSDVLDGWDDGEWRVLTYAARRDTGPATAVFAVPRLEFNPDAVRVVLVDELPDELPATARTEVADGTAASEVTAASR